jgi:tRNA-Thr(GGU) m(6)t(6)A37 methyltransferase TsaA
MTITIEPIGEVKCRVKEPMRQGWGDVVSELVLKPEFAEAIEGLEQFSYIIVLFWMHKAYPCSSPWGKIHPRGRQDLPLVGLFATRSPIRPNPIGIATVKLLEYRGNILKVTGLDAIDGTPILDIKPYLPECDSLATAKFPDWVTQ